MSLGLVIYMLTALGIAHGTCFVTSVVHISVYAITDDLRISDETGPVAEGVCSIGILMYVLFVNFCSCRGTQVILKRQKPYLVELFLVALA